MSEVREYVDGRGRSPFAAWFNRLDPVAAAKVAAALARLALENFSNVKGVGAGVFEHRIDSGPGYRIYFGKEGAALVILLGGRTKRRQSGARASTSGQRSRIGGTTSAESRRYDDAADA